MNRRLEIGVHGSRKTTLASPLWRDEPVDELPHLVATLYDGLDLTFPDPGADGLRETFDGETRHLVPQLAIDVFELLVDHVLVSGKGARVIDENQIPDRIDEPVVQIRVLVANQIVEHLRAGDLVVPGRKVLRRRRARHPVGRSS
jgi:hypothetical protein